MTQSLLDPVTLEILWTRLISAVDEAAAAFVRTSFSTLVREANDYAVVLTDRKGRNIAQSSQSIPSFIATMPATIKHFIRIFGTQNMREGDVFITNDPWMGSGHLNDSNLAIPIFRDGVVIAFAGVVSHLPDIGGRLRNVSNRELFEEGLQIPPMRLLSEGVPDATLINLIKANVRSPEDTVGDIWAQIACCQALSERMDTLIDETGVDIDEVADEIIGRTNKAMREAIAQVPNGVHRYVLEHDAPPEMPGGCIRIECTVTIEDEHLRVDYAGSSEQVPLGINTVLSYTFAYTAYALKALFAPWVPNNEGSIAAMSVTAPEGSIVNPLKPAPCGARGMIGHLLPPAVFGALWNVMPDRVQSPPGSPSNCVQLSSLRGAKRYSVNAFIGAGQGASAGQPGVSAISFPSNLANTPIEVLEAMAPVEVITRSIHRGSGGAGLTRGGDGIRFEFEVLDKELAIAAFTVNRIKYPAPGLAGGSPGAAAQLEINGKPTEAAGQYILHGGDRVLIVSGGGGGYGSPPASDVQSPS